MKKLSVLLFAMVLSGAAFSQAQFALGLKAGPNFANIDANSSLMTNYKSRTGFHGGAFALIKLTKIGIQPEILFSQQGSKFQLNSQDAEANYNYFNVPIILKLYTIAGINLQVGPQFGFVGKASQTVKDINGNDVTTDIKDKLKGSDFSLALGAGWDLPFGITIDGRYNLGLSKINEGGDQTIKNQVWQVSLGYKFIKLGK